MAAKRPRKAGVGDSFGEDTLTLKSVFSLRNRGASEAEFLGFEYWNVRPSGSLLLPPFIERAG